MTDYSDKLNPEQKKAVTHDKGPLLIVAGAGTGKTTVISQRIQWLITNKKAKPDEILALTFTDKAAGEMEERVDQLLPMGYVNLWISTFHSFAEKILQQHGLDIGIPNDFKLLNQTEQWMLVRQNLDKFNLDFYKPLGSPTKFIHALIKLFSRAKDDVISAEDYLKYAQDLKLNADSDDFVKDLIDPKILKSLTKKERQELMSQEILKTEEVANAFHIYQGLLLENNSLDFGDLINYCLKLFKERPVVLAKYRQQFKYILVDEFQDTNYAQYEMVKLLAEPNNNITVVGDDDQSIYKFRGASVSNILEFKQDYPKAAEIFLTKNYRSTQDILDLSYKFIQQNNPNRLEVKLSGNKLTKKLSAQTKVKGEIKHWHFAKADDEIKGVLTQIDQLKKKDKDAKWSDFAILSRTNEVANNFAIALSQTKIPYRFMASRGLYAKPIVLDILAYLRLLDDYHESNAVYRILNSPVIDLDHKDLVQLNYWSRRKGYSLYTTLQQAEVMNKSTTEIQVKITKFLDMVIAHTDLAREKSVNEVIISFLEDSGYLDFLSSEDSIELVQATSYLNQFYRRVNQFAQSNADASVKNYLEFVNLELEAGETGSLSQDLEEGPDTLKVLTIHAAKGLEFKYVWIVSLIDRRFPTDNRPDPIMLPDSLIKEILPEGDVHLQEERRLFYVAMTRAKQGLYLTSAADYGGSRKKKVSRFLPELAEFGFKLDDSATVVDQPTSNLSSSLIDSSITKENLEYLLPKRFSFSQLNSFVRCPYHYWLDYILKIPQKGKHFFSFGTTIHSTLQHFFLLVIQRSGSAQQDLFSKPEKVTDNKKALVSLKELLEIYNRSWIDDWYSSRADHDRYKKNGEKALKEFYKTYEQELPVPKQLETSFTIFVQDDSSNKSYAVNGKIDRIDQINSGVEIIDYKTGNLKSEKNITIEDKRQLLIYQLAVQRQMAEKVVKLTYYYLEGNKRVSFVSNDKDLQALEDWIIKTINEIYTYDFPAHSKDCKCRTKDLRNL